MSSSSWLAHDDTPPAGTMRHWGFFVGASAGRQVPKPGTSERGAARKNGREGSTANVATQELHGLKNAESTHIFRPHPGSKQACSRTGCRCCHIAGKGKPAASMVREYRLQRTKVCPDCLHATRQNTAPDQSVAWSSSRYPVCNYKTWGQSSGGALAKRTVAAANPERPSGVLSGRFPQPGAHWFDWRRTRGRGELTSSSRPSSRNMTWNPPAHQRRLS